MKAPYTQVFEINGIVLTSVVLDEAEFNSFVNSFAEIGMTKADIELLVEGKHIPMIKKGTKTQQFFDRYGIETEFMSAIVRGAGSRVMAGYLHNPEWN